MLKQASHKAEQLKHYANNSHIHAATPKILAAQILHWHA